MEDYHINIPPADPATAAPATVLYYRANEVGLALDLPDASLLVLADHWVPGWRVSVDGESAPLLRVNGALRVVLLESGAHEVVFCFLPPVFLVGLALTVITTALCLVFLMKR